MARDNKYGQVDIPGVPDDEPVFILRAQDDLALHTITRYRNTASSIEDDSARPNDEWFAGLDQVIEDFGAFRNANPDKIKVPD